MPTSLCCVPKCSNRGGHRFPKDQNLTRKWIVAIRRDRWTPTKYSIVCSSHFRPADYISETAHSTKPLYQRLKQASVPSIFAWSRTPRDSEEARRQRATERAVRKSISDSPLTLKGKPGNDLCDIGSEMECSDHNTEHALNLNTVLPEAPPTIKLCENSAQTDPYPPFSIERFMHNNSKILNYTGCDTYKKFRLILNSLGPAAYELNYYYHAVKNVSIENQLFLTLVKLRMHWTNFVLADMFEISETTVSNIFITWINFMYHQWKEVNIWPSRDLVSFFQPTNFREKFPKTRVIIDGTECPVKKPKPPIAQQATFSTYKNRNTVKILVGATPGGLISYVSEAFGGSTSDRQIVERSSLMTHCDPLDSIMADKGFNVQDIFASFDVSINIPSFFKKKNRLDGTTVQRDRVISSKRVHIERLIGLAKTFKIMRDPLTIGETNLSTEIFFVCCMLTNFKEGIISKSA